MGDEIKSGFWRRTAPALTLILAAPMIAEVLPGATRLSSLFVLPIEMGIWGIGALLIRGVVRRIKLGWANMLLLALALSVAEEFLIQQTSIAPLVIQLVKGAPYARDFGVNWLYLLWALGYESVLVVLIPVMATELMFPARREQLWLSKTGVIVCGLIFAACCYLAWFSWTQMARVKIFHLPPYTPSLPLLGFGFGAIMLLLLAALGPFRRHLAQPARPLAPPPALVLALIAALIAALWYGLVVVAFRAAPQLPPLLIAALALLVAGLGATLFARWSAHERWKGKRFAVVAGALLGSMGIGFVGFIGASKLDLYGKAGFNLLAIALLIGLWRRLRAARSFPAGPASN